jgi:very-short-patch-repair endonuclease
MKLRKFAAELRKNMPDAEKALWQRIRHRQLGHFKFRRQYVIKPYVVDFVCLAAKLVIEIDGGQHAEAEDYDTLRTNYIEAQGYRVVRFWNNEVLYELDGVLGMIISILDLENTP